MPTPPKRDRRNKSGDDGMGGRTLTSRLLREQPMGRQAEPESPDCRAFPR
jgi:hypothetical protein